MFDARVGYIVSWLTVRKERRQRGGWYWSVYHRAGAKLQRVYLGRSASLTHARLEAVAHTVDLTGIHNRRSWKETVRR